MGPKTLATIVLTALLAGCPVDDDAPAVDDTAPVDRTDADRDGHAARPEGDDCDDTDPSVFPGAPERVADGLDQDCDGLDQCPVDRDGDGHGDEALATGPLGCEGEGVSPDDDDCDDANPDVAPGAEERCNGRDDDCNGRIDDVARPPVWQLDRDDDGAVDPSVSVETCDPPPLYVRAGAPVDCDDLDPATHPGATEQPADGIDQDCDGVDHCWPDTDGDGFGAGIPSAGVNLACNGAGFADDADDCDDTDPDVSPTAPELCGLVDHDCDGVVGDLDDDVIDPITWWVDADGDLYGNPDRPVLACLQPPDTSGDPTDCRDTDDEVFPGAEESCNGLDDDCDELVDAADPDVVDAATWYRDRDGDGAGDPDDARIACTAAGEYDAPAGDDCDDTLAIRRPDATEQPGNGVDEDCDGRIACFVDADGDGLAGPTTGTLVSDTCVLEGWDNSPRDCDDTDPDVQRVILYGDFDQDGFGNPANAVDLFCTPDLLYITTAGDCDDGRASVNPDADEIPANRRDDDCDGLESCYRDADGDGFGAASLVASEDALCVAPGEADDDDDCDDTDPAVRPGATERVADGVDQDCDGLELCFVDGDGDGHGTEALTTADSTDCRVAGAAPDAADCDDTRPAVSPSAPETCVPGDDDCNGLADDEDPRLTGAPTWWPDGDGDLLGDAGSPVQACLVPTGHVDNPLDCDDDLAEWGETCPFGTVAAGERWTCAGRVDDDLLCVGDVPSPPPPEPLTQPDVRGRVACAVREDGGVACWGAADPRLPAPVDARAPVDLGPTTACALDALGTIECWGDDTTALVSDAPAGTGWHALAVAADRACALDALGHPTCWGSSPCPTLPSAPLDQLDAWGDAVCGLDPRGRLVCAGCADPRVDEAPADALLRFADVALGPAGACAVTVSGDGVCWGHGGTLAGAPSDLDGVTVGDAHACGVAKDGRVPCWGVGVDGELDVPGPP